MTEMDDELLVSQFFAANPIEIEDKGFSRKVAQRLPRRTQRIRRVWTAVCSVLGLVFFLLVDGVDSLRNTLVGMAGDMVGMFASIHAPAVSPLVLVLAALTLVSVWGYNVVTTE